jgi:hypothetical protein
MSSSAQGNGREYLLRRIQRDAPEVYGRLKAGEFPSVRSAAIAAALVRVPTPLGDLRRAWKRATALAAAYGSKGGGGRAHGDAGDGVKNAPRKRCARAPQFSSLCMDPSSKK